MFQDWMMLFNRHTMLRRSVWSATLSGDTRYQAYNHALPPALSRARGSYRDTFFLNRQHEQGRLLWPVLCFLAAHHHCLNEDACFKAHFPGAMTDSFPQSGRDMFNEHKHVQV